MALLQRFDHGDRYLSPVLLSYMPAIFKGKGSVLYGAGGEFIWCRSRPHEILKVVPKMDS